MVLTEEERMYLVIELGIKKQNAKKWELGVINAILDKLRSEKKC